LRVADAQGEPLLGVATGDGGADGTNVAAVVGDVAADGELKLAVELVVARLGGSKRFADFFAVDVARWRAVGPLPAPTGGARTGVEVALELTPVFAAVEGRNLEVVIPFGGSGWLQCEHLPKW